MAKVEMPYSATSAAATSSCVLSGFDAQSAMSAPPSRSAIIRFAVSVVTCRHAPTRTPVQRLLLREALADLPDDRHLARRPLDAPHAFFGEPQVAHVMWNRLCRQCVVLPHSAAAASMLRALIRLFFTPARPPRPSAPAQPRANGRRSSVSTPRHVAAHRRAFDRAARPRRSPSRSYARTAGTFVGSTLSTTSRQMRSSCSVTALVVACARCWPR